MEKAVDLQSYRDATQAKRDEERKQYPKTISGLRPISLVWSEQRLVIEYATADAELHAKVSQNPAWAINLFGVVAQIVQSSLKATIICPDRVAALKSTAGEINPLVIRVVYRTREVQEFETRVGARTLSLKGGEIQHVIPPQ